MSALASERDNFSAVHIGKGTAPSIVNDMGIFGLSLLVGVGAFKVLPFVAGSPVDATIVAFGLTLLGVLAALVRSGLRVHKRIVLPVLLWASMYPALFSTEFSGRSLDKLILLFGVLFICAAAPMLLFRSLRDFRLFLSIVALQGFILSLGTVWVFGAEGTLRAGAFGASVLHAAQLGGALLLVALTAAFHCVGWRRVIALGVAGLALIAVVGTGTRAAVMGVVLTAFAGFTISRWHSEERIKRFLIGSFVLFATWMIALQIAPDRALSRIRGVASAADQDLSFLLRRDALRVSFEGALESPWGVGVNNFGYEWLANRSTQYYGYYMEYPHNLFAETAVELGLLSLALLVVFLASAVTQARRLSAHPFGEALLLLLIYAFLQSLTRGDITDQRLLFVLMGAAIVLPTRIRDSSTEEHVPFGVEVR
jgi:O-antigen ligase